MCECCVRLNVSDESASLLVLSVCADGSSVWHYWCPGCRGELRFLYCDDVRLWCAHEMLKLFHGDLYAVCAELKNLYLFEFCLGGLLSVSCVGVCGCGEPGWVLLGWRRMEVCVMGICGESRDV